MSSFGPLLDTKCLLYNINLLGRCSHYFTGIKFAVFEHMHKKSDMAQAVNCSCLSHRPQTCHDLTIFSTRVTLSAALCVQIRQVQLLL
jgi:hypothetical protein